MEQGTKEWYIKSNYHSWVSTMTYDDIKTDKNYHRKRLERWLNYLDFGTISKDKDVLEVAFNNGKTIFKNGEEVVNVARANSLNSIDSADDLDIAAATHASDAYAIMELSNHGKVFQVGRLIIRTKVQAAGNVTVTPSKNGVEQTALGALSMTAENSSELMRRMKTKVGTQDSSASLKFQNATAAQSVYFLDVGVEIYEKPSR